MINQKTQAVSLSIVIPVFNEQDYLKNCLDAVAAQTVKPLEVIVVDNNSSDDTVKIASSYSFVKVIHEHRQGKIFAQITGFNAAEGAVIGRIDADTELSPNWVKIVTGAFSSNRPIDALTGSCYFYDFPLRSIARFVHIATYYYLQKLTTGITVFWGSNMAIRSSVWHKVRASCSQDKDVHEDIDLSLRLHLAGYKIKLMPKLLAGVSLRRGDMTITKEAKYLYGAAEVYWKCGYRFRAVFFGLALAIFFVLALPLLVVWSVWKSFGTA